jgi:PAS domain S-box-containing protein
MDVLNICDPAQRFAAEGAETAGLNGAIFRAMADAAPSGICVVTGNDLRVKWVNAAFTRFLDNVFTGKNVSGMLLSEVLPGYFESGIDAIFRHVASTRIPYTVPEYRYDFFARGVTYWHWSLIALPAPADTVPDLMFQTIEVTETVLARQKTEILISKCEQQQRLFDTVLSSTPDCNYVFDLRGRFSYANRAFADLLQRPSESIVGKDFFDLGYPHDLAAVLQRQIQQVVKTERVLRDEKAFTSPSGQSGYYEYILAPVFGKDGSVEAVTGSTRDITERKLAEQALRDARDGLEIKILERTAQLVKTNALLKSENAVRLLAEKALLRSKRSLRQLAAHQESIKEEERKRIAREIHDELGQHLLVLRMDVSMLHARTGKTHPKLHKKVGSALKNIDDTIHSIRSIINNLRPAVLDLGLHAAIEWQVKKFEEQTGIACDLLSNTKDITLADNCTTALFRAVQESLTNVVRHSRATQVLVELYENGDTLFMKVSDNGVGACPDAGRKKNSFGLLGIKERINTLGGELHIKSAPDQGVTLTVSVPTEIRQMQG